jgi:hypothetical protein
MTNQNVSLTTDILYLPDLLVSVLLFSVLLLSLASSSLSSEGKLLAASLEVLQ